MTSQADRFARAMRADARVVRAAHPFVASMLEAVRRPVMRLPRIGLLVQQTDLVREVMSDTDRFTKNGPGASSDLWTPVLGDRVLVNMHGPDHHAMRRTLQPIFAPGFVNELVREMVEPRWKQAAASLAAGDRVDIAKVTREGASDAIAVLVGLDRGAVDDAMFESVTQITGMVKLTRPRLTDQQAQRARDLLAQLTEHAHAAYAGDESTVPGRMRALGLSEREALGAVGAFILTGTETLAGAIPRSTAMLADADWFSQLTDDAAADRAIAESLRWTTPSLATLRSALVDTEIGGAEGAEGRPHRARHLQGEPAARALGSDERPGRRAQAALVRGRRALLHRSPAGHGADPHRHHGAAIGRGAPAGDRPHPASEYRHPLVSFPRDGGTEVTTQW